MPTNQKHNRPSENRGISLVAILVGLAIAAIMFVQLGRMLSSSTRNEGSMDSKGQFGSLFESVRQVLGKEVGCSVNFQGKEIDSANSGDQTTASFAPDTFALNSLAANGTLGDKLIKVGDRVGVYTITEMKVQLTGNAGTAYFATLKIKAENTSQPGIPTTKTLGLAFETTPSGTPGFFKISRCKTGKG